MVFLSAWRELLTDGVQLALVDQVIRVRVVSWVGHDVENTGRLLQVRNESSRHRNAEKPPAIRCLHDNTLMQANAHMAKVRGHAQTSWMT